MRRRVAIVGAGVGAAHVEGYRALPERYELAAVCDLDLGRARAVAGGAPAVADMSLLLADPAIDIVDICLPPHLHEGACIAALEAGKHAVCEKPLALSPAGAGRLAEAEGRSGRRVFPVFQYRYGIGTAQLRAAMEAGLAGRALAASVETHWCRGAAYYAEPWRGTWAGEGGGALLGHAIHAHDLLSQVMGPVEEVFARVATRANPVETEDCAALSLRMASGALATSSVTLGAARDESRLRFVFEGLTATSGLSPYAPASEPWRIEARAPRLQSEIDEAIAGVAAPLSGYAGLFEAVADALDGRGGREVTLAEARASLELVAAAYASARGGRPERLPLAPGHPMEDGWAPA